jgi:hypothetical protein
MPAGPYAAPPPIAVVRGKLPSGQWIELVGPTLRVGTTDPADVQPLLDAFRAAGLVIRRVQPVRPSLEELFIETVDQPGAGNGAGRGAA